MYTHQGEVPAARSSPVWAFQCQWSEIWYDPNPFQNRKYSRIADIFRALAMPVSSCLASAERYSITSIFWTSSGFFIDTLLAWRNAINCAISVVYSDSRGAPVFAGQGIEESCQSLFQCDGAHVRSCVCHVSPTFSYRPERHKSRTSVKNGSDNIGFFHYMVSVPAAVKAENGEVVPGRRIIGTAHRGRVDNRWLSTGEKEKNASIRKVYLVAGAKLSITKLMT